MKYSKWYLNLALWLRKQVRMASFCRWLSQHGTITEPVIAFFEVLLDVRHQETFSHTIPNRNAQDGRLFNYHVPKL